MNCLDCEQLFMRYMDNELTEKEALILRDHLDICPKCNEEFLIYDKILTDFTNLDLIDAPVNFEINIMEKINQLPKIHENVAALKENAFHVVWGIISILIGISVVLLIYKDQIVEYLSQSDVFSGLLVQFKPVSDFANNILLNLSTQFVGALNLATGLFTDFRLLIVIAIVVTGFIVFVTRKFIKQK